MDVRLSTRMRMNAELVPEGTSVADIGCDHGYVSIYLATEKRCSPVIAMDVNEEPLKKARENIIKYGVEDLIECRLSDGLGALNDGEVRTALIAGMGGILMRKLLEQAGFIPDMLVLQPQSDIRLVREWIIQNGFHIIREAVCEDCGKFYFSIAVERGTEEISYSETELCFGRRKLRSGCGGDGVLSDDSGVFEKYIKKEINKRESILSNLPESGKARRNELLHERELLFDALG